MSRVERIVDQVSGAHARKQPGIYPMQSDASFAILHPNFFSRTIAVVLIAALAGGSLLAEGPTKGNNLVAADLLPASVIAYAEAPRLGDLVELVVDHPLRKKVESMPVVAAVLESDNLAQVHRGIAAFEGSMGQPWPQAIASLTDQGVHLGFDSQTQGVALLIKSSSRDQLERFRGFILALGLLGNGDFGIAQQRVYRGFTAYTINDTLKLALVDNWFLLTNQPELGKSIIDRYIDGGNDSLSEKESFTAAMETAGDASLKAYIDLDAIRSSGIAKQLYSGKTENVAVEALFGGIVANLQQTPYAVAMMTATQSVIELSLSTPHEVQWTQGREYFFGEDGTAPAPPLLTIPNQLFAFSAYRDLSQMWLRAPDLMTDKANEDLAKADTNLTTFFSGRDFGEDILGSLHPQIQLVVGRQSFDDQSPKPAMKLPDFALQFRMRNPEATTAEFRRVFMSFVGFINVVGAMQGQPQLDLDFEQSDTSTIITASYVPPLNDPDLATVPINYNFSPTLAFSGDRMLISSSSNLAKTLAKSSAESNAIQSGPNTRAVLNSDILADILQDNKAQLVAKNMLEKGHGPDQADAEISVLFDILGLFRGVAFELDVDDGQMNLTTLLQIKTQ